MKRERILNLFKRLQDEKLLMGSSDTALDLGREAYKLAGDPEVDRPWRQVAAYRLAHLKLRVGTPDTSSLNEILELLKEAAGETDLDPVGPLPLIYQLPVYSQLATLQPERKEEYEKLGREVFEKAVQRFQFCHSDSGGRNAAILAQSRDFNLLELAAYFTQQNYSRLLGCGSSHLEISGSWCLLSNRGHSMAVQYNKSFAHAELESVLKQHPTAIAFRQNDGVGNWEWWTSEKLWQPWAAEERAQLIAIAISDPNMTTSELSRRLDKTQPAVRKARSKLVSQLEAELPGRDPEQLQWGTLATIAGEIPIFTAISSRVVQPARRT